MEVSSFHPHAPSWCSLDFGRVVADFRARVRTTMRMPASADLLDMFRSHFDELVDPPIEAHEVDPKAFGIEVLGRKHNISIHIMRRKASSLAAAMVPSP